MKKFLSAFFCMWCCFFMHAQELKYDRAASYGNYSAFEVDIDNTEIYVYAFENKNDLKLSPPDPFGYNSIPKLQFLDKKEFDNKKEGALCYDQVVRIINDLKKSIDNPYKYSLFVVDWKAFAGNTVWSHQYIYDVTSKKIAYYTSYGI